MRFGWSPQLGSRCPCLHGPVGRPSCREGFVRTGCAKLGTAGSIVRPPSHSAGRQYPFPNLTIHGVISQDVAQQSGFRMPSLKGLKTALHTGAWLAVAGHRGRAPRSSPVQMERKWRVAPS